jgi:hypothetical protein
MAIRKGTVMKGLVGLTGAEASPKFATKDRTPDLDEFTHIVTRRGLIFWMMRLTGRRSHPFVVSGRSAIWHISELTLLLASFERFPQSLSVRQNG